MPDISQFSFLVEVVKWYGVVCVVCSLGLRLMPSPEEIPSRTYTVIYNVLRRGALNAPWTPGGTRNNTGGNP